MGEQPTWWLLLLILGLLSVINSAARLLLCLYAHFLRPPKDLRRCYGQWAVVTGPTSGIGRSIAFELARRGLDLVLVGRNPAKLRDVAAAITDESKTTQVRTVVFDLAGDVAEGATRLREAIAGLDVGLLVNNAGVAEPSAVFFHEGEVEAWARMVRVNLEAPTEIARAVLPGMLERRRGAVVNVGSGSTVVIPSYPLFSVYAATKGYVAQFSKCLYNEYRNNGIDVQCQAPLYVATSMTSAVTKIKRRSPFVISSEDYARAAIRWVGHDALCIPNFAHFLQWCFASFLPDLVKDESQLRKNLKYRVILQRRRSRKKAAEAAVAAC